MFYIMSTLFVYIHVYFGFMSYSGPRDEKEKTVCVCKSFSSLVKNLVPFDFA